MPGAEGIDMIDTSPGPGAREGLRTLCVAYRPLSAEQYEQVCHLLTRAKLEFQDQDKLVAEAYDLIERDLILLGATADKAADTIESLHKAGMKVWVLTGDKMETAAATCYASKLFRRSTQILELTTKRTEEQSLHDVLFELSRTVLRHYGGMPRDTSSGDIGKNSLLTWPIFTYWTVLGIYDAIVMFFGAYFLFDNTTFTSNGQKKCDAFEMLDLRLLETFRKILSSGPAWLSIILLITASLLPDVVKKVFWRALWPTTTERIQQMYARLGYVSALNADKLYKGQLSEFTPLAALHPPPKAGSQRGSENQRNAANPRRSDTPNKKIMLTRWQRMPDYCTFTPLLLFSGSHLSRPGNAYSGVGPETAV
ncbi:hypothetical protein GOODEAATRI_005080 [Goodea atripinnis]|uniref:Uncharacterized protein n=1 Tax=Goodea atripinnis TaxID=208336 RepID=A0ABV0PBG1_9TELE